IYDFCECFNFPLDVVFIYINSKEFKLLPLDESAIRKEQEQGRLNVFNSSGKLYTKDFEFLIEKKRQVAATKGEDTSERKEQAG
ncbi:hypothetical protein, partial [Polaribacter sp.]|uniref:hypothetical protein n=1 Tax=Polaribacter sp. TaxID=1920175 RepID=UPI003296C1CB